MSLVQKYEIIMNIESAFMIYFISLQEIKEHALRNA